MLPMLLASLAYAQDTVDIGVLQNSDIRVVQKILHTKEKRLELGATLGVMPFDGFTVAPTLHVSAATHLSEKIGIEGRVGGGYGLKTARYELLDSPTYGVAVEAYRYLASAEADLQWTPIYAKMNLGNGLILHHDVYGLIGAGASLEQSVLEGGPFTVAPTFPVGLGARVFLNGNSAIKVEVRDDLLIESRAQSQTTGLKQNTSINVGISVFGKAKK
jgi:outer membrane beta-barrel protein